MEGEREGEGERGREGEKGLGLGIDTLHTRLS